MSTDMLPIFLERIFYPNQVVRALPNYDKNGDKFSNSTSLSRSIDVIKSEENKFALKLDIQLDLEKSLNPAYEIQLTAVGVFKVNDQSLSDTEMKRFVFDSGTTVLIGALRERIAMLTHSGPWGVFNINIIQIPPISLEEVLRVSPPQTEETGEKTINTTKKVAVKKKATRKRKAVRK